METPLLSHPEKARTEVQQLLQKSRLCPLSSSTTANMNNKRRSSSSSSSVIIQTVLFVLCCLIRSSSPLQIGETCSTANDQCNAGLQCETCAANGNTRPRCTRIQPTPPTSKANNLPFNKYSWLTTHNSYAMMGAKSQTGTVLISQTNQEDTVTNQLKNGVRGLMLDMYDFENDIWLCHSFQGTCYNVTAFQPAVNVLNEIQTFLSANPSEIVTIFIEDYVTSTQGLTKVFNASGLSKYMFPLSSMPTNGGDWPTVDEMVNTNQRLVVFSSKSSKEATEGIAYEWNYVVENQYGNGGMTAGSCPSRGESSAMNTTSKSLVLMNYFPTDPNVTDVCADNSDPLISMMNTCYQAADKRWPNFIAVDYYQKSDGAGAPLAIDEANGHMTCGCDNIAYCRANATYGTCDVPQLSPPPPAAASTTDVTSTPNNTSMACLDSIPARLSWLLATMVSVVLLM